MNHRAVVLLIAEKMRRRSLWLGVVLAGLVGCAQIMTRPQAADEPDRERYEVLTIGDISIVGNAEPTPLGGVGIVVGLNGAGGDNVGENRATAEHELQQNPELWKEIKAESGFKTIKEFLNSHDVAVVLVSASLPPGANKGDSIDVQVALPPKTRATSLRGGYLLECILYNYNSTNNLMPSYTGPQTILRGHAIAKAWGPILVGIGDGDERLQTKRGRIWSGAHVKVDAPLALLLNTDYQSARWAAIVAGRVNEIFDGGQRGGNGANIADAIDVSGVPIRVPTQYKLNQPHYLRIVRAITLYDMADKVEGDGRTYRQRLAADLLVPAHTLSAAIRLEALGQGSIPQLLPGLKSDNALVRFASAQGLAYLNNPAAAPELAQLIEKYAALRSYGLTALASIDESAAETRLMELLQNSTNDEVRYGAFRALKARNERNPAIHGEELNDSFTLHRIMPRTAPLIHVSTTNRAEIALFGEEPTLLPPFQFLAGDCTVRADADADHCMISRIPANGSPTRRQCTLRLDDILRAMADMGATFPDAVELIKQGDRCKCLSCRVRFNALPIATDIMDLVKAGKGTSDILNTTTADQSEAPTLFDSGERPLRSGEGRVDSGEGDRDER